MIQINFPKNSAYRVARAKGFFCDKWMVLELRQHSVYVFVVISGNIEGLLCGDGSVFYYEILYRCSLFKA